MTAASQPRPIMQADADWFAAKYPDGADCIERWTKSGEFVIVKEQNDGSSN